LGLAFTNSTSPALTVLSRVLDAELSAREIEYWIMGADLQGGKENQKTVKRVTCTISFEALRSMELEKHYIDYDYRKTGKEKKKKSEGRLSCAAEGMKKQPAGF